MLNVLLDGKALTDASSFRGIGGYVRCLVDGKIDKLGSDRRTLTGSWNCGATKADFKITRDRDY